MRREGVRLVTVTGPGGVGKTRLAIRVVEQVAADFPRAAWFVSLSPVQDPSLVASSIANTLGAERIGDLPAYEQITTFLGDRRALVVLDNLEHLPDAGALIADVLGACPRLTILATSRAVLGVSGEHVVVLPPMELPDLDWDSPVDGSIFSESVRLFVERAQAASHAFAITEVNARPIAEVCRRLDGLPLAIELAAARSRMLSPSELLERLDNRLTILVGGPKDQPARLRTMRDTIAWSYGLLEPADQALFRRLSVFVGGFALEAAEAIGASRELNVVSVLNRVGTLVDQSLLQRVETHGVTRFSMLETVREFGLEMLGACSEEGAARESHAAWCRLLAERAGPELSGPDQHRWVERLETELGNIRAALDWLIRQDDVAGALGLANAISWFWTIPGRFHEARDLFHRLIAMPNAEQVPGELASALYTAADLGNWLNNLEEAAAYYERSLALYRIAGDWGNVAVTLRGIGSVAIDRGDPVEARRLLNEALELARAADTAWEVAATTNLLGIAAFALRDHAEARACHSEALERWKELGDTSYVSGALTNIGLIEFDAGRLEQSEAAYREAFDVAATTSDSLNLVRSVEGFGYLAAVRGDLSRAARLLGFAEAQFKEFGTTRRPAPQAVFERLLMDVRSRLTESAFTTAWQEGLALTQQEACVQAGLLVANDGGASSLPGTSPSSRSSDSLTRRETEVLSLLCEGLTDREIATRLFISPRTASNHVSSILAKFGVTTRTAAAHEARGEHSHKPPRRPTDSAVELDSENEYPAGNN